MQRSWVGRVFIATSLDGYIARRNGDISWLTDPPAGSRHVDPDATAPAQFGFEAHMASVDHIVMGRGTYEKILTFDSWPYPQHPVIVVSSTLPDDDRVTVVHSIDAAVAELDRRGAKGVYVDGGIVIREFLRRGMIDELTITTAPVLLGDGIPLFGSAGGECTGGGRLGGDVRLTHLGSASIGSGMVTSRYAIERVSLGPRDRVASRP